MAAAAFLVPVVPASAVTALDAVVTLTPSASTLGGTVTAAVGKSTKPAGDSLRTIRLSWGDGSKAVTLSSLSSRPNHRYSHAGAFTVRLTLVDQHGNVAHGSAVEHVSAPAGSYTGVSPRTGLHFFVSSGHPKVQDVSDAWQLHCSDNNALDDALIVPAAPLNTDGSFATSRTDTGILNGQVAKYAYHFAGDFTWSSTSGVGAAGTMRETVSFPDSGVTCTTNTVAWTAERDIQPAQTNTAPPAGSYTGLSPRTGLHFFVSFAHTKVQDVSDSWQLHCSDNNALDDALIVPAASINADGSFATSRTDAGILKGQAVDYSYRFRGNFHSVGADGAFRAAGTMRETVSFPDSGVTCTTDTVPWTAERDIQPAQTGTAPPAGGYTGLSPRTGLTFTVASSTSIQNVSDPWQLHCSDNNALDDGLIVPAATINADGSFAATVHSSGILNGHPTDYTYTFRGNFHSIGPDQTERAAGTMRETVTFTDTNVMCTTDTLAWTAHRTS